MATACSSQRASLACMMGSGALSPSSVQDPCHGKIHNLDGCEVSEKRKVPYLECCISWTQQNGRALCAYFLFGVVRAERGPLCPPPLFSFNKRDS